MQYYHKLVRDKIPEILKEKGLTYRIKVCQNDEEYEHYLKLKLQEEVAEYIASGDISELADIEEVIFALIKTHDGVDDLDINNVRLEKKKKRGGFERQIILEWVND